jgi:hypothetical protein
MLQQHDMTLETQITQQQYDTKQQTHKLEKKHQRNVVGALLRRSTKIQHTK